MKETSWEKSKNGVSYKILEKNGEFFWQVKQNLYYCETYDPRKDTIRGSSPTLEEAAINIQDAILKVRENLIDIINEAANYLLDSPAIHLHEGQYGEQPLWRPLFQVFEVKNG